MLLRRHGDKFFFRSLALHLKNNSAFSGNDKFFIIALNGIFQQFGSRAYHVGEFHNRAFALRMNKHLCLRVLFLQVYYCFHRKAFVYMACSIPQNHLPTGDAVDIFAQVAVRTKD